MVLRDGSGVEIREDLPPSKSVRIFMSLKHMFLPARRVLLNVSP